MPKVILEKQDIIKLIDEAYNGCEIVDGLNDDTEIVIRVKNFEPKKLPPQVIKEEPKKKEVRLGDGSVDAKASGLTLEPRKGETIPGGAMTGDRGSLPVY